MKTRTRILLTILLVVAGLCMLGRAVAADSQSAQPKRVEIIGYNDHAMEPFISRDGRYLLFNNLNQSTTNTDIHFAERKDDSTWLYRGKVKGVNTPELEANFTMDRAGRMFFTSPRDYSRTLCITYTGMFKDGNVTDVQMVPSLASQKPGMVNFDVEVSPDGKTLLGVDSWFKPDASPRTSDIFIGSWDGARFVRSPDSDRLLSRVNKKGALQYASTISSDKLTLYFTRFDPASGFPGPQIYCSTRRTTASPFGTPVHVKGLGDFVEGTAFSPDEHLLYFHRKDAERHNLYAIRLPQPAGGNEPPEKKQR
jgi:hypothetical protein